MKNKVLMKGNEAIAEAAIRSGCRHFFGYPITPQTEVAAYMAKRLPKIGGVFMQAESEVAAINMLYGAVGAGVRAMTSSSSPGISLKAEGISYIAGADLPAVIVNIMRAGPGLGGIQASQADYFQATKGLGHGDYKAIVLAPSSIQESADYTMKAFDLADKYRMPVMLLGDGILGQMMEPVVFAEEEPKQYDKSWATNGTGGKRPRNIVNSLYIEPSQLEELLKQRYAKYAVIEKEEVMVEVVNDSADIMIVAYGTMSRVAKAAVEMAKAEGINVGLVRPITLYPFPYEAVQKHCAGKYTLCVEMSMGQMIEDVRLATKQDVAFYGRTGGVVPTPKEIVDKIKEDMKIHA